MIVSLAACDGDYIHGFSNYWLQAREHEQNITVY